MEIQIGLDVSIMEGKFSPWELLKTKDHNDFTFGALFLEREE